MPTATAKWPPHTCFGNLFYKGKASFIGSQKNLGHIKSVGPLYLTTKLSTHASQVTGMF